MLPITIFNRYHLGTSSESKPIIEIIFSSSNSYIFLDTSALHNQKKKSITEIIRVLLYLYKFMPSHGLISYLAMCFNQFNVSHYQIKFYTISSWQISLWTNTTHRQISAERVDIINPASLIYLGSTFDLA